MKKIYTLAIALMSGIILTACVGAVNIGGGNSPEFALINRCIVGNTAQADPTCAKAVTDTNGCITDPFSSGCEVNPVFSPHVQNARDERAKFCDNTDNSKDSLCTGSDSEKDICTHNPFIALCGNRYYSERQEAIERCTTGNNANDGSCNSVSITLPCIANPFSDGCDTHEDFKGHHATAGANRVAFCKNSVNKNNNFCLQSVHECSANPFGAGCDNALGGYHKLALVNRIDFCGIDENSDHADCAVTLSRVTAASWLQSFDVPLKILSRERRDAASTGGEFVKGAIGGLGEISSFSLDMSSLGGDESDGFAFIYRLDYFSGIFSGTDLGLPITEKTGSVKWDAKFSTSSGGSHNTGADFILTINFGAGDKAGTIDASVRDYSLTGNFDSNGLITGNVVRDINIYNQPSKTINGTLTGLIGQEGAVGVFISDSPVNGYSGGFVATPLLCILANTCVDYADWMDSFTGNDALPTSPNSAHTANQFLSGLTGTLPIFSGGFRQFIPQENTVTFTSLTLAENGLGGESTDGASFFYGSFGETDIYYAGIHASTDLGAPLDNVSQAGTWKARIRTTFMDQAFNLTVTFDTTSQGGTISAFASDNYFANQGGTISAATRNITFYYDIDGTFDKKGIIKGDIIFGLDRDNDKVIDTMRPVLNGEQGEMAIDTNRNAGTITGIIGQDGLVGAFYSTNDDGIGRLPFAGGFVARPRSN
ncbi:MAG: hypothetical protein ACNYPD_05455 [Candidatus Halichondribacter symbioticus]